jgi:hypothetical protein
VIKCKLHLGIVQELSYNLGIVQKLYDSFWMILKCNLHLITFQWVLCTLLKVIVQAFLATKFFAVGSSTYPCQMACVSKSVLRDVMSLSDCRPQRHRSAVDVMHNSWG